MRILLAANASYVPPRGGATRSNLVWLERLAGAGHECRVMALSLPAAERQSQLADEGMEPPRDLGGGVEISVFHGVSVYAAADPARRIEVLHRQSSEFQPDWLLVSSEDVGHVILRHAHRLAPGRVVYLAHTPQFFPFGPESWNPEPGGAEMVARSAGVVVLGRHMAGYLERNARRRAGIVHPPIYGDAPFHECGAFSNDFVTIVNPCAVKGITIFTALAKRFPQVAFAALPGWGTTSADRSELEALPNVTLLPNCRDIERVLERTRVLLMPSLWYEGFGLSTMEAMLRGVPVIASDSGGLEEAKSGTGYVVPVRPIEEYEQAFDERGMPRAIVPLQEIDPWASALEPLVLDRECWEKESLVSRKRALEFVSGIPIDGMERFLQALRPVEPYTEAKPHALSPEKRALLLARLRQSGGR